MYVHNCLLRKYIKIVFLKDSYITALKNIHCMHEKIENSFKTTKAKKQYGELYENYCNHVFCILHIYLIKIRHVINIYCNAYCIFKMHFGGGALFNS